MKQRNTDIDWIRAILIILMILIHIVSFVQLSNASLDDVNVNAQFLGDFALFVFLLRQEFVQRRIVAQNRQIIARNVIDTFLPVFHAGNIVCQRRQTVALRRVFAPETFNICNAFFDFYYYLFAWIFLSFSILFYLLSIFAFTILLFCLKYIIFRCGCVLKYCSVVFSCILS